MAVQPSDEAVLQMVAQRLRSEPEMIRPTLQLLADPNLLAGAKTVEVARRVNAHRLTQFREQFQTRALPTSQVAGILGVTRQALSARVGRRRLLALELGGTLWFSDWQFGPDGLVPEVDKVVPELLDGRRGVLAADALMRTRLDEEGGRSPAELLAAGSLERCLHYVRSLGADR